MMGSAPEAHDAVSMLGDETCLVGRLSHYTAGIKQRTVQTSLLTRRATTGDIRPRPRSRALGFRTSTGDETPPRFERSATARSDASASSPDGIDIAWLLPRADLLSELLLDE